MFLWMSIPVFGRGTIPAQPASELPRGKALVGVLVCPKLKKNHEYMQEATRLEAIAIRLEAIATQTKQQKQRLFRSL